MDWRQLIITRRNTSFTYYLVMKNVSGRERERELKLYVNFGVLQQSILGPILYYMLDMANNIPAHVRNMQMIPLARWMFEPILSGNTKWYKWTFKLVWKLKPCSWTLCLLFIFFHQMIVLNYEKCFSLHLRSSFCSQDIQILVFPSFPLFLPVGHCFRG